MDWPESAGLSERERQAVVAVARSCRFGPRDVVFHEGDHSSSVHLITSGHFAVRVTTPDGERATLNVLGPGGWFGELPVTDGAEPSRRSATVLALDESSTLVLTTADFQALCSEHPAMGRLVQALMAARIRELSAQLLQSMYVPLDRRLCSRLLDLLEVYPARGGSTLLPLTQEQIADMVGGTRPSVNQALQQLVSAQIIEIGRGRVVVLDRPALERAAAR
ncbi:MAG: Crp/Fnr family transcriptional regulator [Marmoricola sp.]